MSADNWTICPKCRHEAQAELDERRDAVSAMYGTVPVDEFDAARAAVPDAIDTDRLTTFREDNEIYGARDGTVHISYRGTCTVCGLTASHEADVVFYEPPAPDPAPAAEEDRPKRRRAAK